MTKLYELNDKIDALFRTEEFDEKAFEELQLEKREKVENIAKMILNKQSDADALENEIKRMQARLKSIKSAIEWSYDYLDKNIDKDYKFVEFDVKKQKCPPAVEIKDEEKIPKEYFEPQDPKLKKSDLAKALKAGIEVPGAILITRMKIKIG